MISLWICITVPQTSMIMRWPKLQKAKLKKCMKELKVSAVTVRELNNIQYSQVFEIGLVLFQIPHVPTHLVLYAVLMDLLNQMKHAVVMIVKGMMMI